MLLVVTLVAAAAAAEPPIIVTAKPQTEKALAECLARKCGTREDAIASIQHAQAQFADGEYPDARKTLLSSLTRNRGQNDEDPRAMSALWHALARVTLHNGDMQEYRRAALRSGSILSRADTVTTSEQVRGEVQIADALSMTGHPDGAVRRYRAVGREARERGDIELA
jgi:predicted negative regulator of RcsB-dependent stress response